MWTVVCATDWQKALVASAPAASTEGSLAALRDWRRTGLLLCGVRPVRPSWRRPLEKEEEHGYAFAHAEHVVLTLDTRSYGRASSISRPFHQQNIHSREGSRWPSTRCCSLSLHGNRLKAHCTKVRWYIGVGLPESNEHLYQTRHRHAPCFSSEPSAVRRLSAAAVRHSAQSAVKIRGWLTSARRMATYAIPTKRGLV